MKNPINQPALLALFILCAISACSSGDGDTTIENPNVDINSTTWDSLVWDDGTKDKTRKWAD